MTRRNVEIDLPRRFAQLYGPAIDVWLETAIPGMTLCIPLAPKGPSALRNAFVTSSALEKVVELRAVDISSVSGPCLLVEPADRFSKRLVDEEEKRLTPAKPATGIPTGVPITASFGVAASW